MNIISIIILLIYIPILQLSGILKNITKQAPKAGRAIKGTVTTAKTGIKLSKSGKLLIADDLLIAERITPISDEAKMVSKSGDEIIQTEKSVSKESGKIKRLKNKIKNYENEIDELIKDRVEEAIEDLLYEKMTRDNNRWDYSIHQLLNNPFRDSISTFIQTKYGLKIKEKADLFFLLNEMPVEFVQLSRRDVAKILSKYSLSYKIACIDYFKSELVQYEPVIKRLQIYIDTEKIKWKTSKTL
jgi:hypothetical protein